MLNVNAKILIAVSFDRRMEQLIQSTVRLFHGGQVEVTLAHVLAPPLHRPMKGGAKPITHSVANVLQNELQRIAERRLERVAATIRKRVPVETVVLAGASVAETLLRFAEETHQDLMIIGATRSKSMNCALDIISRESIPVMILHEDTRLISPGGDERIVIGDDLGEGGVAAIAWAFKIACLTKNARILHTHVIDPQELFFHIHNLSKGELDSEGDYSREFRKLLAGTARDLEQRFISTTGLTALDPDIYDCEVSIGQISQELLRSATAFRADFCVFATHKLFHPGALTVGHLPIKDMISHDRIITIVPPKK